MLWKVQRRDDFLGSGETIDKNRCKDIGLNMKTLLSKGSSEQRIKLPIYTQLEILPAKIPPYDTTISEDNTSSDKENLLILNSFRGDESENPPFESSVLYDFLSSYNNDRIIKMVDSLMTITKLLENQKGFKEQRYREAVEKGKQDSIIEHMSDVRRMARKICFSRRQYLFILYSSEDRTKLHAFTNRNRY